MRISLRGLLRLKPFDESADGDFAEKNFSPSLTLDILVNASTLTTIGALVFVLLGRYGDAATMLALTLGLTALCAGAEWHAGLKAHALNHLFSMLLYLSMFALVITPTTN